MPERIIRINQWLERYEVNSSGQAARSGDKLRQSPLDYIRSKVYGHKQGMGYRLLLKIAGRQRAMQVFGIFHKLLEIAGDEESEKRGVLYNAKGNPATVEDLAFILDIPAKQVEFSLQVLANKQLNWISIEGLQETQGIQGKQGIPCPFKNSTKPNSTKPNINYCQNSIEFRLASSLLNLILKRKHDYKKPDLQSWARHIDLMIRVDNRKPEKIEEVILWCQQNDFWQNNILSTSKLRKQFDKLELQMQKDVKSGIYKRKQFNQQNWGEDLIPTT